MGRVRRGFALAVIATAVVLTSASTATQAAVDFTSELEIKPAKMGTERHPRGVQLAGHLGFEMPAGEDHPILTRGRLLIPRGIRFNGADHKSCTKEVLDDSGPKGCPASIVGSGRIVSLEDPTNLSQNVTLLNGGARRIWAYTVLYNPTLVKEPVAVAVKRLPSRKWAYALEFVVPSSLRVVAGVPITLPAGFNFRIGGKAHARAYVTTDAKCPKRGFLPYRIELSLLKQDRSTSELRNRGRLACA